MVPDKKGRLKNLELLMAEPTRKRIPIFRDEFDGLVEQVCLQVQKNLSILVKYRVRLSQSNSVKDFHSVLFARTHRNSTIMEKIPGGEKGSKSLNSNLT
jgi:hypothetical protein